MQKKKNKSQDEYYYNNIQNDKIKDIQIRRKKNLSTDIKEIYSGDLNDNEMDFYYESNSINKGPLESFKGDKLNINKGKDYNIVNPVEKGKKRSINTKIVVKRLSNNKKGKDEDNCNKKRFEYGSYKVNYFQNKKKEKDENFYARVIQRKWKIYKENKIRKETILRNIRKFVNIIDGVKRRYYVSLKKLMFYRMDKEKNKQIEVTAKEYFLIQHLKELGINSVNDFRRVVASIIKESKFK